MGGSQDGFKFKALCLNLKLNVRFVQELFIIILSLSSRLMFLSLRVEERLALLTESLSEDHPAAAVSSRQVHHAPRVLHRAPRQLRELVHTRSHTCTHLYCADVI